MHQVGLSQIGFWIVTLMLVGLLGGKAGAQSSVVVIPEKPVIQRVTLQLGGQSCDVNRAESAVLHLQGVVMVDIESKPGHLIVSYERTTVSIGKMMQAIGKKARRRLVLYGERGAMSTSEQFVN